MRRGDIDRYFREAAKGLKRPVRVYLTGGVASWLMGGGRPTVDIDFAVKASRAGWMNAEKAFSGTSLKLGIPAQFSEDISRWGMIEIPGYEKTAKFYKTFGTVSVYFLSEIAWSVGKLTRYHQSDLQDLVTVFKKGRPSLPKALRIWAAAVRKSPKSSSQFLFLKNVENFLGGYGRKIWGPSFSLDDSLALFRKLLGDSNKYK